MTEKFAGVGATRRVLQVIHYPMFGGPHNQVLRLDKALVARGWNSTVLLPNDPGNAAERLAAAGIDVRTRPLSRLRATYNPIRQAQFGARFWGDVRAIRELVRAGKTDLVIVSGLANPHAAVAARLERTAVVWQIVDSRSPWYVRKAVMPFVRALSDAVMFDGHSLIDLHLGARPLSMPSFTYYPPVDTATFTPSDALRRKVRAELGIPDDARVVGTVSNLSPQKGIEYFIRAAGTLARLNPETRFVVIGARYRTHEEYFAKLERELEASGIPRGHFIFAGARENVEEYYPAMDVKVISSVPRSEGTTTTAMEAMACGVPVVATDVGAVSEVVEDGVTGFVVPPLDPGRLASAVSRLFDDVDLRGRMASAARRRAVVRFDVGISAEAHVRAFEAALAHHQTAASAGLEAPSREIGVAWLRDLLVCPACHSELDWGTAAHCNGCGRSYQLVDGIPILLVEAHSAEHDELDHLPDHAHKHQQSEYFDREDAAEFEITRPFGATRLYRWLLDEKFRRSVRGLEGLLPGSVVLTVCGGSGMDAEFLARAGARVICSDISVGAAKRAQERARRRRLDITSVVADIERLPFGKGSVDVVYVHDGLHHLEAPANGIDEMARVAARGISITEPAEAGVTELAVKLGLALEREDAGNRVARLAPDKVAQQLESRGFRVEHAGRYAMYYAHKPGRISQFLSGRVTFPLSRLAWQGINAVGGRFGNKLTVTGIRRLEPGAPTVEAAPRT